MPRLLALALIFALAGCARLSVEVDVLDPVYVRENLQLASLRADATRLAQGDLSQAEELSTSLLANYDGSRKRLIDQLRDLLTQDGLSSTNRQSLDKLPDQTKFDDARIRDYLATMNELDLAALGKIKDQPELLNRSATVGPPVLGVPLRDIMISRRAEIARFSAEIAAKIAVLQKIVNDVRPIFAPSTAAKVDAVTEKVLRSAMATNEQQTNRTILGSGTSLADRAEAYMATTKEADSHWAPVYNRAIGRGRLGATDVAIKMNGTADFTIKGFVFDARSTAQMMQKVGVRAISLIATAYGLPAMRGTGSDGKTAATLPDPSKQISDATATVAASKAEDQAYRADLFRIADSLLGNWNGVVLDHAGRQNVRAALAARAGRWKIADASK